MVAESLAPGASASKVAQRYGVNANLLFTWRRQQGKSDADGFVAGLLVCPELIKPSEWLPVVWGSEEGDEPAFDSLDHLNRVLGLVMEHYNDVARTLIERPHSYGPLFAVDKRHNEVLWETWIAGSEKAAKLRPAA